MLNVELIIDKDCPNVNATRANLMRAFSQTNLKACWKEWDRNSKEAPDYAKKHGSPTLLINGNDLMGVESHTRANCCRVYEGSGTPSVELITSKLSEFKVSQQSKGHRLFGFLGTVSIGPSMGAAFLAKASCPFCYPAIAGFLTSLGLGFLFKGTYFYILMSLFLGVALFGLGFKASSRKGYGPLFLGSLGAVVALVFHYLKNDYVFYLGISVLIIASIWNLLPARKLCNTCK